MVADPVLAVPQVTQLPSAFSAHNKAAEQPRRPRLVVLPALWECQLPGAIQKVAILDQACG